MIKADIYLTDAGTKPSRTCRIRINQTESHLVIQVLGLVGDKPLGTFEISYWDDEVEMAFSDSGTESPLVTLHDYTEKATKDLSEHEIAEAISKLKSANKPHSN